MSRRGRVGLGLIGLGPAWEQVYRDPLVRLQSRLTIRLVYDPVEARSRSVAGEFEAEAAGSLRQILTRHTLQGLLVLDPGWCGAGVLNLIARCGKPAFLSAPVLRQAWRSIVAVPTDPTALKGPASKSNDQLMPELGLRFTPASCRLRELMATKLGRARRIEVDCDLASSIEDTATLIDWCTDIMGQTPTIWAPTTNSSSAVSQIEFEFPPSAASSPAVKRIARLRQQPADKPSLRIELECERGRAVLSDRTHITWQTAADSADESLTDERTELEILIDQFCRRALGGLNPVARFSEFVQAMQIARSVRPDRP